MTLVRIPFHAIAVTALAIASHPASAQQAPDAGRVLREEQQQLPAPAQRDLLLDTQLPAAPLTLPGGTKVVLKSVAIEGNTVIQTDELLAGLGETTGKTYDLAGLRGLAESVASLYRGRGYPFARAYLPPQTLTEGNLRITVLEGRYGKVQAYGEPELVEGADAFLAPLKLKMSEVIESSQLERTMLVLDDLPGVKVTPTIRPGSEVGTGDLDVRVERAAAFSGDIGFDNHGNRYTGEYRVRANMQWDSPFSFGDQLTARLIYSDEGMWFGNLGYSLPLGVSGLRGNVGYAHTYYQLGKDFGNLGATGTAKVVSAGISYPIVRSQQANLSLAATLQHKTLNDKQQSNSSNDDKSSDSLPVALNFDYRDGLWGGGITYGSLTYTAGRLKLGSSLESTDRSSGQNTRGSFDKLTLDIARAQATPLSNLTLFARLSAQQAGKNLDSSEGFSLGGANGVRAYPNGEGNGDQGWLTQLEARYASGAYNPYVFYDAGYATINAKPGGLSTQPNPNHRSIGGTGIGLRYQGKDWSLDTAAAWRTHGAAPLSDPAHRTPRIWLTLGYKL